jgi:hypothetical protein
VVPCVKLRCIHQGNAVQMLPGLAVLQRDRIQRAKGSDGLPSVSARLFAAVPNGVTKLAKTCKLMILNLLDWCYLEAFSGESSTSPFPA